MFIRQKQDVLYQPSYTISVDASDEKLIELQVLREKHQELRYFHTLYGDEVRATESGLIIAHCNEMIPRLTTVRVGLSTQANDYLWRGRKRSDEAVPRRWMGGMAFSKPEDGEVGSPVDYMLEIGYPTSHNKAKEFYRTLAYWASFVGAYESEAHYQACLDWRSMEYGE